MDALEVLADTWKKEATMEDLPGTASPYCQAVGLCGTLKYGIMKMTGSPATIPMIGGGVAGVEAARIAAKRGHKVSLYEKSERIGGSVGIETAEFLAQAGKKVTVIEMQDTVAERMVNVTGTIVLGHLKGLGVTVLTSCKCKEVRSSSAAGLSVRHEDLIYS